MSKNPQMLISTKEAAALRGEDPRSIQRKAKAGIIPFVTKLPGSKGAYIFNRADVEALDSPAVSRTDGAA